MPKLQNRLENTWKSRAFGPKMYGMQGDKVTQNSVHRIYIFKFFFLKEIYFKVPLGCMFFFSPFFLREKICHFFTKKEGNGSKCGWVPSAFEMPRSPAIRPSCLQSERDPNWSPSKMCYIIKALIVSSKEATIVD